MKKDPIPTVAPRQPIVATHKPNPKTQTEPLFDELLTGDYLYTTPILTSNRLEKITCCFDRDEAFFREVDRLKQVVVMSTNGLEVDLTIDEVADIAITT